MFDYLANKISPSTEMYIFMLNIIIWEIYEFDSMMLHSIICIVVDIKKMTTL